MRPHLRQLPEDPPEPALPQGSLIAIHDSPTSTAYGLAPSFAPVAALFNVTKRLAIVANVGTLVQAVPGDRMACHSSTPCRCRLPLFAFRTSRTSGQNAVPQGGATPAGPAAGDKLAAFGSLVPPPSASVQRRFS